MCGILIRAIPVMANPKANPMDVYIWNDIGIDPDLPIIMGCLSLCWNMHSRQVVWEL
jgi:hypothetical protein